MRATQSAKAGGAIAALLAVVLAGTFGSSRRVHADDTDSEDSKIQQGFAIAPVPLNLAGKDRNLVGLGSWLVNAVADCDGCHTSGGPPNFNYANRGNPYFGQHPAKIDPATYLGGGNDFGQALPGGGGPDIIARNLTPDKTGRAEGGRTFQQFLTIIRTGADLDKLHPTCTAGTTNPNCIPPPVDGSVLQVMPWPVFRNMSDHDLQAIYEYLSAIPCIAGPPAPSPLHNDCR